MELTKAKLAIIGLTVGLVVLAYFDMPTYLLQLCVVGIAGLGGYELRGQVEEMKSESVVLSEPPSWWHKYYFRVIGYFLSFGGFGLIFDELINGNIEFWPPFQHEVYGIVLGVIGLILISIKPHGKSDNR